MQIFGAAHFKPIVLKISQLDVMSNSLPPKMLSLMDKQKNNLHSPYNIVAHRRLTK